jgi:tetratricopeptide (TPR) repeat protein
MGIEFRPEGACAFPACITHDHAAESRLPEVGMKRMLLFLLTLSSFSMALAELSPEAQQLLDTAKIAQTEARQSNPKGNIDQAAWRKAVDAAEAAVKAAPREAGPLRLRAQVYTEIKFWVRAESSWRTLFNAMQDNVTPEDRVGMSETLFNLGYNQYQSGDLEGAYKRFAEASEITPEAARNEIWQGRILLERGDARGALPHWDRALKLEPANATSKYFLLISQKSVNYGEAAVSAFTLGYKAFEAKKYEDALQQFRIATVSAPAFLEAQRMLGRTALELNLPDDAIPAFETVAKLEGVNPSNKYNLELAREMRQFGTAAARSFREGYDKYAKGDKAAALAAFEAATVANPNYQKAWAWLGRSRFETGDYRGAADAYGIAVKLDPNDKDSQHWLRQAKSRIK